MWLVTLGGAAACVYTMFGLPAHAWERFAIWMVLGLVLYFVYGFRHSTLRRRTAPVPVEPPPPIEKP
jgi:APA family basic amino acid/polyamine antiporter